MLADGPASRYQLYLSADIGDNDQVNSQYSIYRFAEPGATTKEVSGYDKINFKYPDGAHDADAILVDNNTKDIYIITKTGVYSRIYKLSYPQNTASINTAILCGSLSFNGVTSAALSPDGKEILVKTYEKIYYWKKGKEQTIEQTLAETPLPLSLPIGATGRGCLF